MIYLKQSYHIITVYVENERVKQEMLNFIKTHSKVLHSKPAPKAKKKKVN